MVAETAVPSSFESKTAMYDFVEKQFVALMFTKKKLSNFANLTIGLANASSLLFYGLNALADPAGQLQTLPINWVGFYLLQTPDLMTLGPFQGRVACTEIRVGKGVCGTAVSTGTTQLVPDVHLFPGHIACDGDSASEIVVPIRNGAGNIVGVLDVDSTKLAFFDTEDQQRMERLTAILGSTFSFPCELPRQVAIPHCVVQPSHASDGQMETKAISIGDWLISSSRRRSIASDEERKKLESDLAVLALPEILFPMNQLTIVNKKSTAAVALDATGALRNAIEVHRACPQRDDLRIRAAPSWAQSKFETFDANVDWAWRNEYEGDWRRETGEPLQFVPCAPGEGINWTLLRDQSQPMLLFEHLELFEDDLHDCGTSELSVKLRVMPSAFFVLLRHFVRVDCVGATVRETRFFHEISQSAVVVETSWKILTPDALSNERVQQLLHHGEPVDELVTHMVTTRVKTVHVLGAL